jgi:hypothetical protein
VIVGNAYYIHEKNATRAEPFNALEAKSKPGVILNPSPRVVKNPEVVGYHIVLSFSFMAQNDQP